MAVLEACTEYDLRPIVGAEIDDPNAGTKVVALVKNSAGYANLCRLLTRRHRDPGFNLEQAVPALGQGLILLTPSVQCLTRWHGLCGRGGDLDLAACIGRAPVSRNHPLCRAARKLNLPVAAVPGQLFSRPRGSWHPRVVAGY